MKIAYFLNIFPVNTQTWVIAPIVYLLDRGHDVQIFTNSIDQGCRNADVDKYNLLSRCFVIHQKRNIEQIIKDSIRFIFHFHNFKSIIKLFSLLKEDLHTNKLFYASELSQFSVAHCHFSGSGAICYQLRKEGLLQNTKLFVSLHTHYDFNSLASNSLSLMPDKYIVNSEYSKNVVRHIIPDEKIFKIPCPTNCSFFDITGKKFNYTNRLKLCFLGRLVKSKGPDLLVKICSLLRQKIDFECAIIGDGVLLDYCKSLANSLSLNENVKFVGALSPQEVRKALSICDLFVFPGILDQDGEAETQGVVIQEAQALGLPVICSDVGGCKEGVINGETGYVIKERDLKGFVDKIVFLDANREVLEKLGLKGRENVIRNYDTTIIMENLIKLYKYNV